MTACISHLFYLHMITVTIARRNHADLDETFDDMFPPPYGFVLTRVYTDNRRVLCKMYVRDTNIARHLTIPGRWWCGATDDKTSYDGVVVSSSGSMHDVYVPDDDRTYAMRGDAVSTYADDLA